MVMAENGNDHKNMVTSNFGSNHKIMVISTGGGNPILLRNITCGLTLSSLTGKGL